MSVNRALAEVVLLAERRAHAVDDRIDTLTRSRDALQEFIDATASELPPDRPGPGGC